MESGPRVAAAFGPDRRPAAAIRMVDQLPVEQVLDSSFVDAGREAQLLGLSREGREILGYTLGQGPIHVSLIGGCHADEPVGPEMLSRLAGYLVALAEKDPLLTGFTWLIVPHVNPDGAARNRRWSDQTMPCSDSRGEGDRVYALAPYVRGAVRELPGDDIEFGFPRSATDRSARPENLAVAGFLRARRPFRLHISFHGMAYADGPWFLIDREWIDRTVEMRRRLASTVHGMGYRLFDIDRRGEKGFFRVAEGFSTRPDSEAMREFFRQRGEDEVAARFRPSSMEFVRSLGGDPLTLVSEMPLFLLPQERGGVGRVPEYTPGISDKAGFQLWLQRFAGERSAAEVQAEAERIGLRGMPIRDQMRLQVEFLNEGLRAVRRENEGAGTSPFRPSRGGSG